MGAQAKAERGTSSNGRDPGSGEGPFAAFGQNEEIAKLYEDRYRAKVGHGEFV